MCYQSWKSKGKLLNVHRTEFVQCFTINGSTLHEISFSHTAKVIWTLKLMCNHGNQTWNALFMYFTKLLCNCLQQWRCELNAIIHIVFSTKLHLFSPCVSHAWHSIVGNSQTYFPRQSNNVLVPKTTFIYFIYRYAEKIYQTDIKDCKLYSFNYAMTRKIVVCENYIQNKWQDCA